jgi:Peptidase A4 family
MDERIEHFGGDPFPHFRTFTLPPSGFDPREASERELLAYGLPRRPNPETHPVLAKRWDRIAGRRHEFVTPELKPLAIRRHVDQALIERRAMLNAELARYADKQAEGGRSKLLLDVTRLDKFTLHDHISLSDIWSDIGSIIALLPETSSNWSGAYVKRPASEPIVTVSGDWTIPGVNPPTDASGHYTDGTYIAVAWVGIDGTSGSGDVLQAGTGSQCVVSGGKFTSTRFFAWTEWFGLPWVEVANFPVSVGDQIACTVCAPFSNTHGVALFNNLTTGQTTTIGIDPPASTSLVGNVAEWILEDPGQASGALYPFPVYSGTTFTGCTAGSKTHELYAWDGKELDMVQGGTTLSSGVIQGKQTVFCHYGP